MMPIFINEWIEIVSYNAHVTMPIVKSESKVEEYILRISKSEMSKIIDISEPVQHYHGPKKPDMLDHSQLDMSKRDILLHSQEVSLLRARELDVQFLNSVLKNDNVCEYGGYLTKISREQNHTVRPATQAK